MKPQEINALPDRWFKFNFIADFARITRTSATSGSVCKSGIIPVPNYWGVQLIVFLLSLIVAFPALAVDVNVGRTYNATIHPSGIVITFLDRTPLINYIDGASFVGSAIYGHDNSIEVLPKKETAVKPKELYGKAALISAAGAGRSDTVQSLLLLNKGIGVNAKDGDGYTALMAASGNGHIDTVRNLLDNGADANVITRAGETALMWAAMFAHTDIVRVLLDNGADVNIKNKDGETAMMWAAMLDFTDIVRLMQARGAEVNAKTLSIQP